jgi:hypothetical protein
VELVQLVHLDEQDQPVRQAEKDRVVPRAPLVELDLLEVRVRLDKMVGLE